MQNPLRRRTRALTAEQYDEVQKMVFDLVRERLVESFGPTGMYTVSLKSLADEHSIFNETVAESLAWSIAAELAPQKKSKHGEPGVTVPSAAVVTLPSEPVAEATDETVEEPRAEQLVA